VLDAYKMALQADPVSAFGGILATNRILDLSAAGEINKLFFEILIAPGFEPAALELLRSKKNRIILEQKKTLSNKKTFKSILNGVIEQDADFLSDRQEDIRPVTKILPDAAAVEDLLFAAKICKHTKSNAIVLAAGGRLLASGVGQTSRVDALRQAIEKAKNFGLDIRGAAMASDAFFPFPDCVEIAAAAGIRSIIQPGGSVKDQDSIDACDKSGIAMVFTGRRHFRH
jgi:phosphoribosylaminoimidazolecarboxamide formyltransferase/IMP cyclohydrolase